jgi:hypothetical protein
MKADYCIDMKRKDGRFQLLLIEVLERFYEYVIIDGTAFVLIKIQDLKKYPWNHFPEIENEFLEILVGCTKAVLGVKNYSQPFNLLIGYIEAKLDLADNIERIEDMYVRSITQGDVNAG